MSTCAKMGPMAKGERILFGPLWPGAVAGRHRPRPRRVHSCLRMADAATLTRGFGHHLLTRSSSAMPEQPSSPPPTAARVQAGLQELAQRLRQADHLEPEAQQALASLVEELSQTLTRPEVPSAEMAHLAASAAQLAQALQQR